MVSAGALFWLLLTALFAFLMPVGLLLWWRHSRGARLAPFFCGALIFVVFALVLENLLHGVCLLSDNAVSRALAANPYLYMLYGACTAGIFEETGRYVAFRFLLRRYPERDAAVTYGLGHGGIEAMLTLGASYLIYFLLALFLRAGNLDAASVLAGSQDALDAAARVLGALTPGSCLLAMLERLSAMALHVALSVFVFLAVRNPEERACFPFAVGLHAVADMPAALAQRGLLPVGVVEIWIMAVALFALRSARKAYLEEMDP